MRRSVLMLLILLLCFLLSTGYADRHWQTGCCLLSSGDEAQLFAEEISPDLIAVTARSTGGHPPVTWNLYADGQYIGSLLPGENAGVFTGYLECKTGLLSSLAAVPVYDDIGEMPADAVFLSETGSVQRWQVSGIVRNGYLISISASYDGHTFQLCLSQLPGQHLVIAPQQWELYLNGMLITELAPYELAPGIVVPDQYCTELTGISQLSSVAVVPVYDGFEAIDQIIFAEEIGEYPS